MMKIIILFTVLLLFHTRTFAQEKIGGKDPGRLSVKIEYFGELILHPGLAAGVEYRINGNNWFTFFWDTRIGGYLHPWNHTGLFFETALGARFTSEIGLFAGLQGGPGYLRTFPHGDVYGFSENGVAEERSHSGYGSFMPGISLLFGWDGTKSGKLPLTLYAGPGAFFEIPFNQIALPHGVVRVGVSYSF